MTSVPDVAVCETLLNQLRSGTVACSFVQVRLLLAGTVGAASCQREEGELLLVVFTLQSGRGDLAACLSPSLVLPCPVLCSLRSLLYPSIRWAVSTHMIAALAMFPMWS